MKFSVSNSIVKVVYMGFTSNAKISIEERSSAMSTETLAMQADDRK